MDHQEQHRDQPSVAEKRDEYQHVLELARQLLIHREMGPKQAIDNAAELLRLERIGYRKPR